MAAASSVSVVERVRAGAVHMDAACVGWAEGIDKDRLDLGRCEDCVFGQTYGQFDVGLAELGLTSEQAQAYGFLTEQFVCDWYSQPAEVRLAKRKSITAEYAALRLAWLAEIDARLGLTAAGDDADETDLAPLATYDSPL